MVTDRPLKVIHNYSINFVEIGFCDMKTCASWEEKEKRLSNVTNVIILGTTRELKGGLPKIVSKQERK